MPLDPPSLSIRLFSVIRTRLWLTFFGGSARQPVQKHGCLLTNEKNLLMISLMRKIAGFIGGSLSSFLVTTPVFAQVATCPAGPFNAICVITKNAFGDTVGRIINFAFFIAILIALVYLIYGGVKWMISGGDKSAVEEARNHVISALLGLVIVFLSYFILNFLVKFFTGTGFEAITVPTIR